MTIARPYRLNLSAEELHTIQSALWHWEDAYRSSRLKAKAAARESDEQEASRKIARIRNLKARAFRAKTIDSKE